MRLGTMVSLATVLWVASWVSAQTPPGTSADEALKRGTEAVRASHFEEAERWFQAAVNSGPGNPAAQMELGVVQLRLGKASEAAQHLRQAVAIDPKMEGGNLFLGIAYAQMHRVDECVAALRRELEIDPKNALAYMWIGVVELHDGHPEKATDPLDRAVELAPDDLNILEFRGKAHSEVAYASYARMAVIDPNSWHVHHVQGQMLSEQGKHKEAIAEYLEAIKQLPGNPDLYEELGAEYRRTSQLELAQQAFSKELALSLNNPIAMYNLAKIDIETGHTSEGLDLLRKVVANYENVPATYFYLGLGEFDAGNAKEAVVALEKAKAMHPEPELEPRIEYELSRAYKRIGRIEDSNRAVQEYMRLKARNSKLNPHALSAISGGFGTADLPATDPKNKN